MKEQILTELKDAIENYDADAAVEAAKKVIENDIPHLEAIDVMTGVMNVIGDGFSRQEYWLPDLIGAGDTMSAAMNVFSEALDQDGSEKESLGIVALGTVQGDIHNIGKNLVGSLLRAGGFDVIDLGVDVAPEAFVEAVENQNANVVAMSSLLTGTAAEQEKVIKILTQKGLRDKVKIMVGGGAISRAFADKIGADGYESSAPGAVTEARRMLGL